MDLRGRVAPAARVLGRKRDERAIVRPLVALDQPRRSVADEPIELAAAIAVLADAVEEEEERVIAAVGIARREVFYSGIDLAIFLVDRARACY